MTADPIRVGIIGVHPEKGWATAAHIPALRQLGQFRLSAISHHRLDIAREAAVKFGAKHAFDSAEALVTHPDVDLVVVAVKVTRHKELVLSALTAGKAVFCEWPLGMTLRDAVAMRDFALAKRVTTSIGLQTRATPAFAYLRDLVSEGFAGDVLSASVIGSGILWGATLPEAFTFSLDRANGAAMHNVPFGHSIDGLLHALGTRFERVAGTLAHRRSEIFIEETGVVMPLPVPDQLLVTGRLANGAAITSHFRGGLSLGTNFHVEVNGTKGDLIITSPVGYVGIGGFTVRGAQRGETLHELSVPACYGAGRFEEGPSQAVAVAYERLATDMRSGTRLSPTFGDAVNLHRLIDAIERSEGAPRDIGYDGAP
jgi:predicted dehydrogenase